MGISKQVNVGATCAISNPYSKYHVFWRVGPFGTIGFCCLDRQESVMFQMCVSKLLWAPLLTFWGGFEVDLDLLLVLWYPPLGVF